MHASKLIRLLSAFIEEETDQLVLFARSPYFNNGKRPQKVQALLEYLLDHHPDFEGEAVQKERVYEAVFPEEDFNPSKLAKVASALVNLIRTFIAVSDPETLSEYKYWLKQVRFFRERKLDTEYLHAVGRLQKLQDSFPFREAPYFYRQFQLEIEKTKYDVRSNDKKSDANLPEVIRNLDLFFLLSKMEFCGYLLFQNNRVQIDYAPSIDLLDESLALARSKYFDIPCLRAYTHIVSQLRGTNDRAVHEYEMLKEVMEQETGKISLATLKVIHNYMRSYLADRYNHGDPEALSELFNLFQEQIDIGTIYDGGYILASTLQNAITVAIKLGQYDWALDFLLKHENRIHGADDPSSVFEFNLANIYFHQGRYEKTEEALQKYRYRDMFYNLAVRRLEVKLYYETQMPLDVFEARLHSFKTFVHEQKTLLPADKFESNNNFIKVIFQLFTLLRNTEDANLFSKKKQGPDREKVEKLISKLEEVKMVAEREWLFKTLNRIRSPSG